MSLRRAALCCVIVFAAAGRVAAEPEAAPEQDWPVVIGQLQQELYRRPGHLQTRQQLAIAHNNYGVTLGNQGRWDLAVEELRQAVRLDETNSQAKKNLSRLHLNRAHDAFKRHELTEALAAVEQALELDPDMAQAYALRGEIEYSRQKLKEAQAAWQRAIELDPSQGELAKRLERVTEELPVESDFERLSQAYFDVRYQEAFERTLGFDIRDALLEARRTVGGHFAYWPKHKIVVLVYSWESFRALRQETPEWVGGQFDGKIRVPLPDGQVDPRMVKQIIFHEYTHALIHDLSGGKCPRWLDEGIAEYEGRTQAPGPVAQLADAAQRNALVPWAELSGQFSPALPTADVALGYQQSYSIVAYLVERYGMWRIRRLVKAFSGGGEWDAVLKEEYRLKPASLEQAWRAWLAEWLRAPRAP
jgi:hypothetical protein